MIPVQKTEWINFLKTNITTLGSNVYPEFTDDPRTVEPFCTVEIEVFDSEQMDTGEMKYGFAHLMFVSSDTYTLDKLLLDKLDDELTVKKEQFVSFCYGGILDVTETKEYKPGIEGLLKREVDIGMSWNKYNYS